MILLASPSLPFRNLPEMLAYARSHPDKLAYGSFGKGSDTHVVMEWLKRQTKTDILHVPFNGFGPMLQAFNSGAIQLMYLSVGNPGIVAQVKADKMRGMAVLAPSRTPQLPDVPTLSEAGVEQPKAHVWFGLMAPAGTPREIVNKLNTQVNAAMQEPALREQMGTMAMRTRSQSAAEFAAFLRQDREVWRDVVTLSGVTPD
jgi:tripartite-type tricarboxylate transporter receptor subunit TctC